MPLSQIVDVEVPETRRVNVNFDFEFPHEMPVGKAQLEFKVIPFPVKKRMTEAEEIEAINRFAKTHEKEILENLEYQADIFEAGDPDL